MDHQSTTAGAIRVTTICLTILIVSLLVVGFESHTPIRHLVQVTPAISALIVLSVWRTVAATLPVFLIWFALMLLVWFHLLGIAHIINGTFTTIEVVLTILIGGSAIVGAIGAVAVRGRRKTALLEATLFTLLQLAAFWISFTTSVAKR